MDSLIGFSEFIDLIVIPVEKYPRSTLSGADIEKGSRYVTGDP